MSHPPRIWLNYRPVRIGWVVEGRDLAQLTTAARWSTCLWGGRFNPIIPMDDAELAKNLIATFQVDVLFAISPSKATKAFQDKFPHLQMHLWGESLFDDRSCKFVDIRHAVSRATGLGDVRSKVILTKIAHVVWPSEDPLSALFSILFGDYPGPTGDTIDYPKGIRRSLEMLDLEMRDKLIAPGGEVPAEVVGSITPVRLTEYGMSWFSDRFSSSWLNPGILIGDALAFDDLLLFWNLRAAGAEVWFYDQAHSDRLRLCGDAFIAALRSKLGSWPNALNVWSRTEKWASDLDLNGIAQSHCRGADREIWNGLSILPVRPRFSRRHRDVVSNYAEDDNGAGASFALPNQPFDDEGTRAFDEHFVVTVNVLPYGQATE